METDGWLSSRNKPKIEPKQKILRRRTSMPKRSKPLGEFVLTESPPPAELFKATKQSHVTQFFKPRSQPCGTKKKESLQEKVVDETGDADLEFIGDLEEGHDNQTFSNNMGDIQRGEEEDERSYLDMNDGSSVKEYIKGKYFENTYKQPCEINEETEKNKSDTNSYTKTLKQRSVVASSSFKRKRKGRSDKSGQSQCDEFPDDSDSYSDDNSDVNDAKCIADVHEDFVPSFKRKRKGDGACEDLKRTKRDDKYYENKHNNKDRSECCLVQSNTDFKLKEEDTRTSDDEMDDVNLLKKDILFTERKQDKSIGSINDSGSVLDNPSESIQEHTNSFTLDDFDGSGRENLVNEGNSPVEQGTFSLLTAESWDSQEQPSSSVAMYTQSQLDIEDSDIVQKVSVDESLQLESQFSFRSQRDYYDALEQNLATEEIQKSLSKAITEMIHI